MRESSGVSAGLTSLPAGGGGIAPLGDRFQPDLVRGSGSYAIPLSLPKGPNDLQPSLNLTYSTGAGNGPAGQGWRLNLLTIERRSDRGIPSYGAEDEFVIGGAEVLVAVGGNRYRPKADTRFWNIERTGDSWRVRTGDGRTMFFGQTDASRERDGARIFAWHLDEEQDAAGNSIVYSYRRDGGRLYLDTIRYGIFRVGFSYESRPDVLRNARAGFERLTALRLASIELHCDRLAPTLMRTYSIGYAQAQNGASQLVRFGLSATAGAETAAFPELTFAYSQADFTRWSVHDVEALIPPPSLDSNNVQLVDLTGDGLPDVLQSSAGRMYLWRNAGEGRFEGPVALGGVPSTVALDRSNVALADLNGDGRVDLFAVDQPLQLAFESTGRGAFKAEPAVFRSRPNVRLSSGGTRLMDVDGDGVTDLIETGRTHFLLYRHEPGEGWQEPIAVPRTADLDRFPDVAFGERGVRLADMSGDGLQDFVTLESGHVCYWPYLGNGRWGDRVEMRNPPQFPPGYREDRLHFADLDGDGCSDLVYFDSDRTLLWINQSGNGFSAPIEIPASVSPGVRALACDLFGDGRPGFAWTSRSIAYSSSGYRFLRFDEGRKPYLMTSITNGMGGRFEMEYATSTVMRLQDRALGEDWPGELPFIVHVVRTIRERDLVEGREMVMSIRYHDGVYDGPQREFRGFSRVTVDSSGDDSVPATRQAVEFFQGDPDLPDLAERDRQRALAGSLISTRTFELTAGGPELRTESAQSWDARLEFNAPGRHVFFPHIVSIEARELSSTGAPARIERTRLLDYDAFGNAGRRLRESFREGAPPSEWLRSEERFTFTNNVPQWLVRLPVRLELRDGAGVPFAVKISYYDGAAFTGLAEGRADHGLLSRVRELKLLLSRLPGDYLGARDLTSFGYELLGGGDTAGFYATTQAYRRDARGNVVEQRDPLGSALQIFYDADGIYPVRSVDARGKETRYTFDPRAGEPARIEMPDGRTVRYEHDPLGRLAASFETDDAGVEQLVKCWIPDLGSTPTSMTSVVPAAGGRTRAEFKAGTDFAALAGVSVSRVFYDGFGKEILQLATAPSEGAVRRFVATSRTRLNPRAMASVQFPPVFVAGLAYTPAPAPDGAAVRTRYDVQGNVTETGGPGPVHFRVVRDTFSIRQFEGAAAGAFGAALPPGPASRTELFDARGRLVRIEEARGDGTTIATAYDLTLDGRIEVIRDNAGAEMVRYTFAGPAEFIRIRHRDAGARTYYRDAAGRVRERVDADGSALFYTYDVMGRLTRIEHLPAGGGARSTVREIFYDVDPEQPSAGRFLDGRIALVREAGNSVRYSYNRAGKTVSEETAAAGVSLRAGREYDLQGRLIAVVYPDGRRVSYALSESGSVREITGVATGVTYGADGNLLGYQLANGVDVGLPRDPVSFRLNEVFARRGASTLRRIQYTYDAIGNITGMLDEMPSDREFQTFTYDGLHRISSFAVRRNNAAGAVLRAGAYAYDSEGNLNRFEEQQALTLAYGDAAHPGRATSLVTAGGATPLGYNARAHISAMGDLSAIEYDPLDRISRVVKSDGAEIRFAYDPQSRRILKEVTRNGVTTRVHYVAGLYERHPAHSIRNIYLGTSVIASEKVAGAVNTVYYLSDHHGTILLAADAAGAIIQNQRYSPFGSALNSSVDLDRYLSRERDTETGLLHLGARYYAPAMGRFVSADWWVLENPNKPARMPQGYNVYSYALNNPLVFKDPSGMWFGIDDLIVAAVGFVVGFVSGLVYGLVNGQGWGSLLTALETGLTTAAGAWLGWNVAGIFGALMGGMNGLVSGIHGIYDWTSVDGWFAFLSDSTWNLIGTTLGNVVHIINLFGNSGYREDLSHRQNRHVYEGGFYLKNGFTFTQGNVISNAGQNGRGIDTSFIANHEELHVWQQRFFGPLFQLTYVVWAVGGFIAGTVVWFFHTDQDYGSVIETAVYYDNPFEYWAYKNDNNWPPSGANPVIRYA